MTKIYTKKGDNGTTSIKRNGRMTKVAKYERHIQAVGSLDELNSLIGVFIADHPFDNKFYQSIQSDIFTIGAIIGFEEKMEISNDRIKFLEATIDRASKDLKPLKNFILPGGLPTAAHLHYLRAVCRRAERDVVAATIEHEDIGNIIIYLNRLSDLFFVLARQDNHPNDILWEKN